MDQNVYDSTGHGPKLTALERSQLASQLSQTGKDKKVLKKQWKECSCGITTDADEKHCPKQGLEDESKHILRVVELEKGEAKKRYNERKLLTKDVADLERR